MPRNNRPLVFTALNGIGFFVKGVVAYQRAPSFNDLILISNTDVEGGSYYVLASNFGFMLGSLVAGILDGRIQRTTLTIAFGMLFSGAFTILTPWCSFFAAMLVVHCVVSFFLGVYDTTIRTQEIQAWDGSSASALQMLSFSAFVGATITPLITEPFMAPKETGNNPNVSSVNSSANPLPTSEINVFIPANNSLKLSVIERIFYSNTSMLSNCTNATDYNYNSTIISEGNGKFTSIGVKSNLHYAYLITGAFSIIASLLFFAASIKSYSNKHKRKEDKVVQTVRKLPRKIYLGLLGIMCLFYYLYALTINAYDQYLFYFVVTYLNWSKRNGAYLSSLDKAVTTCFKLGLIVVYRYVTVRTVLVLSILGAIVSFTPFVIASHFKLDAIVWVSITTFTICLSAIYGSAMAWMDGNLIKLAGRETSALMISSALGAMTSPLPLALLMKNWSPMTYPYFVYLHLCISAVVLLVMMFVIKSVINRRYGPLRTTVEMNVSADDVNESMVQSESINGEKNGRKMEMVEVSCVA